MKALSHVIISNKCQYKASIIYCFPLRIKIANFFKEIISENLYLIIVDNEYASCFLL